MNVDKHIIKLGYLKRPKADKARSVENSPVDKPGLWKRGMPAAVDLYIFCLIFLAILPVSCSAPKGLAWKYQVPYAPHANIPFAYVQPIWNAPFASSTPDTLQAPMELALKGVPGLRLAIYLPSLLPVSADEEELGYSMVLHKVGSGSIRYRSGDWLGQGEERSSTQVAFSLPAYEKNMNGADSSLGPGLFRLDKDWVVYSLDLETSDMHTEWYLILEDQNRSSQKLVWHQHLQNVPIAWRRSGAPQLGLPFWGGTDAQYPVEEGTLSNPFVAWPVDSFLPPPVHGNPPYFPDTTEIPPFMRSSAYPPATVVWFPLLDSNPQILAFTGYEAPYFEPDLSDILLSLRYLTDRKEYGTLLASPHPKQAIDQFWAQHPQEYREWQRRLGLANLFFTDYRPGFATDRGMVYMVFGPPDLVTWPEPGAEIWSYDFSWIQQTLNFTFADMSPQGLPWTLYLLRSPAYEPVWMQQVRNWRTGNIGIPKK